ncbi:hypothetical protein [Psychroserpens sp.]
MKFLLLLFLCSLNLFSQEDDKIHYSKLVEAYYYIETKNPLYIYDGFNDNIVAKLKTIEAELMV